MPLSQVTLVKIISSCKIFNMYLPFFKEEKEIISAKKRCWQILCRVLNYGIKNLSNFSYKFFLDIHILNNKK